MVNISKHPILKKMYDLMHMIEGYPASEYSSKAIVLAEEISRDVDDVLNSNIEILNILEKFTDNDDCYFDNHGYCQTHGVTKPCINKLAKDILIKNQKKG